MIDLGLVCWCFPSKTSPKFSFLGCPFYHNINIVGPGTGCENDNNDMNHKLWSWCYFARVAGASKPQFLRKGSGQSTHKDVCSLDFSFEQVSRWGIKQAVTHPLSSKAEPCLTKVTSCMTPYHSAVRQVDGWPPVWCPDGTSLALMQLLLTECEVANE